jgi:uncharacterized protein YprB with RNaseH-like and TPR domain
MKWLERDRLAAVGALRRVRAPAFDQTPGRRDDLAALVGAKVERNRYGEFLRVRKSLAGPEPCAHPEALGLVLRPVPEARDLKNPKRWLFLDTETTGLAGGTGTCAFLVGLAWWDSEGLQVEQLFLRDYDEEHAVLLALAERLAERPVLVTYNGKSFDWPLLETRFRLTRQIEPTPLRAHLDLLHPARQLWRLQLGTARLGELERLVLGIERGPDVLSALIPQLYFEYLRGASAAPLVPVFEHNQYDLAGLAALAGHVARLVHAPEGAEPLELYGLSRLLERRGEVTRARRVYEMAIEAGLPNSLGLAARRRLARLARRDGERDVAHTLWRELAEEDCAASPVEAPGERREALEAILEACEQLAIHYEHRERDRGEAAEWTRRALSMLRQSTGIDRKVRERWNGRLELRLERLGRRRGESGRLSMRA